MKVVGLCGASGSGKTSLAEGLIAALRAQGRRVSVIKHAHKRFDIDQPGKDSHRHRQAGAFEVLVANSQRLALVREFDAAADHDPNREPSVHQLLAELTDGGPDHWVLVEGFKHADLPKIEVWRAVKPVAPLYPHDPFVIAVATDAIDTLPAPTALPVLDLNQPAAVLAFLLQDPHRHDYIAPAFA
ncbi:MAG: molybdopterin-guanine dinucleotide biosynthesis protein B [Leptothrix sp. (in: b-proteobacteria)]